MKAPINLDNSHLKDYSLSLVEADWLNNLKKETFARLAIYKYRATYSKVF